MGIPGTCGANTRRQLLRLGLRACAASSVANLLPVRLNAQTGTRSLVCIYLAGGNDSNNLVVPMSQYPGYSSSRGNLAIQIADLLPASSVDGAELGFHPSTAGLRDLFNVGALAVAANIGELPARAAGTLDPDVAYIKNGFLTSRWAATFSGAYVGAFANGAVTGFLGPSGDPNALNFLGTNASNGRGAILGVANGNSPKLSTVFPSTAIGRQLLQVAKVLKSGVTNGIQNRMFFAVHGDYDTHQDQLNRQAQLLSQLSDAMRSFYAATVEIGVAHSVTTFTDSPFGRTMKSNQTGGSDHGWGSHQLIMGGSVFGAKVYGQFPRFQLGGSQDATGAGVWLPTISRSTYAAALATWNGSPRGAIYAALPDADLAALPFLA